MSDSVIVVMLEGPDGAGKTTLADELCSKLRLRYHHEGPPKPGSGSLQDTYVGVLVRQLAAAKAEGLRGVVLDRFGLSELCYAPLAGRQDRLGEEGWSALSAELTRLRAVRILCLPSLEACRRAWASGREELLGSSDLLNAAWRFYEGRRLTEPWDHVHDWERAGSSAHVLAVVARRAR